MVLRQYLIPGFGYINEVGTKQYLVPGVGYVNDTSSTGFSGTLGLTQGADTTAIVGAFTVQGHLTLLQSADTTAINALAGYLASISAIQSADTISIAGASGATIGSVAVTQGADRAAIAALAGNIGSITARQGADTTHIIGAVPTTGVITCVQGADFCVIRGYTTGPGRRKNTGYTPVTEVDSDDVEHRRKLAVAVNGLLKGKMNAVATLTLAAGASSTTFTDPRIGPLSYIYFMPLTAHSSAELASGNLYVPTTTQIQGSAVIQHTNNSQTDRNFNVLIIG